jgi:hypothetical protein
MFIETPGNLDNKIDKMSKTKHIFECKNSISRLNKVMKEIDHK